MTHSKHGLLTPHFKGYCKQVFVVRMIFIGGNGDREGGKGEGWSLGGGLTYSKHGLVTPHLKDNCKQVLVVKLILHKWAWWQRGLGGGVVQGRGYDQFKTWSCDTSFKR